MLGQWKRVGILVVLSAVSSVELFAQAVDDTLRYAESLWSMEKKAMVLSRMNFTEAEKSSFWPVYESYTNATQYLDMEYIRLLRLESDQTLSSREAASIADRLLLNDLLLAKTMLRVQMRSDSPGLLSSLDRVYFSN
jgi:hypothetical protein